MAQRSLELAAGYMAVGLDPERVTLFKQSLSQRIQNLPGSLIPSRPCRTFNALMRTRMRKRRDMEINVGTFNYPMLMAADILLYDAAIVPVGQDQKQHIEYARDTAEKFNRIFSETFMLPEPHTGKRCDSARH